MSVTRNLFLVVFVPSTCAYTLIQIHFRIALSERLKHTAEDTVFDIYLFHDGWMRIGNVSAGHIYPSSIPWSDAGRMPIQFAMPRYRVVTAQAPPFVLPATKMENGSCLTGMPCLQVRSYLRTLSNNDYHNSNYKGLSFLPLCLKYHDIFKGYIKLK